MTIPQTIVKAIEGGYYEAASMKEKLAGYWFYDSEGGVIERLTQSEIFLDRDFWIALGKAMEWDKETPWEQAQTTYKYHWHHFIDHLASGKSPESFFADL